MELIQFAHGSGGRMMHQLIKDFFVPAFDLGNWVIRLSLRILFRAGSRLQRIRMWYLPSFSRAANRAGFPSADGKRPRCLGRDPYTMTVGFIIEEGFPVDHLKRILGSMRAASEEAGVRIIAGDTKVVDRGKADGIFINTAGFGVVGEGLDLSPKKVKPGDRVLLSGSIGNHGVSVMAERNGISFEPPLLSDVGPLNALVKRMADRTKNIRMMRDPTRGGVATTLKEIASESGCCIVIDESAIRVEPGVKVPANFSALTLFILQMKVFSSLLSIRRSRRRSQMK